MSLKFHGILMLCPIGGICTPPVQATVAAAGAIVLPEQVGALTRRVPSMTLPSGRSANSFSYRTDASLRPSVRVRLIAVATGFAPLRLRAGVCRDSEGGSALDLHRGFAYPGSGPVASAAFYLNAERLLSDLQ